MNYNFKAKLWKYKGHGGWYFVTSPKALAKKIRYIYGEEEQGFGRLKVQAQIGATTWATAIWYDSKVKSYLLPVKNVVRKKENLNIEQKLSITILL